MASPVLHIRDSYFFEVPKILYPSHRQDVSDFPDVWIRLDPDFQRWEAERQYDLLSQTIEGIPSRETLLGQWTAWAQQPENFGKPLDVMLQEHFDAAKAEFSHWQQADPARADIDFAQYLGLAETEPASNWFIARMLDPAFREQWTRIKREAGNVQQYVAEGAKWSREKIDGYNWHLSGKILIPQPFGELRNLHEAEPGGVCISKFMIIEFAIALIMLVLFSWLARKISSGKPPRGRLWNLLEVFLVYIKEEVVVPAIGARDADRFVPLLWTMFLFVLFCNLCGMLPWVGAPTGSFSVTVAIAMVTFLTGLVCGVRKFGPIGFIRNQVPSMDLPLLMAIFIKPMLLFIELLGLVIKHGMLAVRLVANMFAGHIVLLGIMGLAFGAGAAAAFGSTPNWTWWPTAAIAVAASTLFSCLELFVAFLHAYVITFLSAVFIGASVHQH